MLVSLAHVCVHDPNHEQLKADEARLRAECIYQFEWKLGERVFHMWLHRCCESSIAGPQP